MLDCFLISKGLIDLWGLKGQFISDMSFSNHLHIHLKSNKLDWEPKPFKFFSAWIEHPGFPIDVKDIWFSTRIQGKKMFIFKQKIKVLKSILKVWNIEIFGKVNLQVYKVIKKLNQLDSLVANDEDILYLENSESRLEAKTMVQENFIFMKG